MGSQLAWAFTLGIWRIDWPVAAWQLQTASKEPLWDYNHEHYSIYWLMSILKPNMIKCTASKQKLRCLHSHWSPLFYFLSIFFLPLKSTFSSVVSTLVRFVFFKFFSFYDCHGFSVGKVENLRNVKNSFSQSQFRFWEKGNREIMNFDFSLVALVS